MNKIFILLSIIILFANNSTAQVTVGAALEPVEGAILDLKEDDSLDENASKGIKMPRVALIGLESLLPCAADTDVNKTIHKGLTVYNVTNAGVFEEGLYVWDGQSWQMADPSKPYMKFGPWYKIDSNPAKASGKNTDDSYLSAKTTLGGSTLLQTPETTEATLGVVGTATFTKSATVKGNLEIDSKFILKDADILPGAYALALDPLTKEMGTIKPPPRESIFIQSATNISFEDLNIIDDFNANISLPIYWNTTDVISLSNTAFDIEKTGTTFENIVLKKEATVEVAGQISYQPNFDASTGVTSISTNVIVQHFNKTSNQWEELGGCRKVWEPSQRRYSQTLTIPPILINVKAGEKIRLVVNKGYGGNHGGDIAGGVPTYPFINVPNGMKFSRMVKIDIYDKL